MILRPEAPADAAAIRSVTAAAFAGAPHASGTEAAIPDALRDAGALTLSLVAEEAGQVLCHVAFSPVLINGQDLGWLGLGPLSVAPEHQRRGIGGRLVAAGLERLRAGGAAGCVVLGDPDYYTRFGFLADPRLRYPAAPARYFLHIAFAGPVPQGVVAYHPAFGA
ncbi:N-acetyltransferase [Frigidibacter sp. MR17.14]|uniref:GNAT family N-acetyltransferase n=1 Tax=Frigidibacter sp. MR17.14 TaxID=3126509 RepID=UPI0030130B3A